MDRNTIIGIALIMLIWFGYLYMVQPTEEELAEQRTQDSIAQVEMEQKRMQAEAEAAAREQQVAATEAATEQATTDLLSDTTLSDSARAAIADSLKRQVDSKLQDEYGDFVAAAVEPENTEYLTIENEHLRINISRKGGRMVSAELKEYHTYDSLPLLLFAEDSSQFDITFSYRKRGYHTSELWFEPVGESFNVAGEDSSSLAMRLYGASRDQYIEFRYGLAGTSNMLDFDIAVVGMPELVKDNRSELLVNWNLTALSKEKGVEYERDYTQLYYKTGDEVNSLSERSSDEEAIETKANWVGFSQQFFSTVYIADDYFEEDGSEVSIVPSNDPQYTKYMSARLNAPLTGATKDDVVFGGRFYLGSNHYQTLKSYDIELESMVNFGWSWIAWFSKIVIVPLFNALDDTGMGYGIIILVLTLLIKTLLFPITYRSFLSSARMKALKPEIDELNEKFKDKDPMEKQKATMALYRKAGVNPTAGCIPMLLQFPILLAMYRFFPASIELRQQPFLWADDLSSYDSIFNFPGGFEIPFYGDHISLFTLLMAISTFLYTRFNMSTQAAGPQMAQMRIIAYLMPFMLLIWFNSYAAGLSYYYLTSNLISIGQHFIIKRWFISEDDIRRKIAENKKKQPKKSKFQERMDRMMQERQAQATQGKKGGNNKQAGKRKRK